MKIDRSFVGAMGSSDDARTIITAIVQMATTLGLEVTAEGIETERQAVELQSLGCKWGQGFFFGRPSERSAFCVDKRAIDDGDILAVQA